MKNLFTNYKNLVQINLGVDLYKGLTKKVG